MDTPTYPLFHITPDSLYCDLVPEASSLSKWTALAVQKFRPKASVFYDTNLTKWSIQKISTDKDFNWLDRLMMHTFYNPLVKVQIQWVSQGAYDMTQLKDKIVKCIQEDDDVLTQFVEADFFIKKVNVCTKFSDLTDIFEKYVIDFDEESMDI